MVATDGENRLSLSYRHEFNSNKNHENACRALCEKMGWHGTLQSGHTKTGMVFVWKDEEITV
jgi:hypothetical protein